MYHQYPSKEEPDEGMKKVTLVFPTAFELWQFRGVLNASHVEIVHSERALTCVCSPAAITLAIDVFRAKLREPANPTSSIDG